jgi:glucans biosynthesis protein C
MNMLNVRSSQAKALPGEKQQRIYSIDWLRMLAVLGVFFIHSGNMFALLYKPLSNNRPTSSAMASATAVGGLASSGMDLLNFVPQWGMSLFFLLSGAGTWFTLRHRTSRQFISERLLRLLIPLLAGCLIIAPFQAYFEALSNSLYQGNVLQFYPYYLGHIRPVLNPQWLGSFTHHLWFLGDLLVFSLISFPLCLYLKRAVGQKLIGHLAHLCERPGGLLVLFVPIALTQVALRASFPGYQNWSDVCCWLICYLYGYILFSHPGFAEAIGRQGKLAGCLGIGGFLAMIALWCLGLVGPWTATPDYSLGCLLFQVLASWNMWCWLVVILSVGQTRLNFSNTLLTYGGAASFPFYLLHFPVVVVVASVVLPWHLNIIAAFVCISACSFLITLALTDLLFMRLSGARIVLGRKARILAKVELYKLLCLLLSSKKAWMAVHLVACSGGADLALRPVRHLHQEQTLG